MRSKLGCLALLLKFVKARIETSRAGVAPTLMADGGRVPCAGDSEPSDENVRSPKPLLSSACAESSCAFPLRERVGAGITTEDDACLADVLVFRVLLGAFDAGVRFLVDLIGISSAAGSAPVMIRSASSTGSGVCCPGLLRLGRVDVALVTKPSLSSLWFVTVSLALVSLVTVDFVGSLRGAVFATRVVVDVILVLFGRGIVAMNCCSNRRC